MNFKLLTVFLVFCKLTSYSQNDTIIRYFDKLGRLTNNSNAAFITDIHSKQSDSLWVYQRFDSFGRLREYFFTKTSDVKDKVGQLITFDNNDSISSILHFDKKGLKTGKYVSWFKNRNINSEGNYLNDKKQGLWKFYHFNGNIAKKEYYKEDTVIKEVFYDLNGTETTQKLESRNLPMFDGGDKKFAGIVNNALKEYSGKLKGTITFLFEVHIDGSIQDVEIIEALPLKYTESIVKKMKSIKGWQPSIRENRPIPFPRTFTLEMK